MLGTAVWLVQVGALWYARPPDVLWLIGSVVLGIGYFSAFMWYVNRND